MYKGRASNPNTCQNEILKWKYNNGKNQNWDDMSLKRCLILSVYFTFTKRIPEEVYRCYMYGGNTGRQTWSRNITTWIVLIYRYKPFLISENVRLSSSGQLHFLVNWVLSRNTFPVVIIPKSITSPFFTGNVININYFSIGQITAEPLSLILTISFTDIPKWTCRLMKLGCSFSWLNFTEAWMYIF